MDDKLIEAVARMMMPGTYTDEAAATEIAVAKYGHEARAIAPLIWNAAMEKAAEDVGALRSPFDELAECQMEHGFDTAITAAENAIRALSITPPAKEAAHD